MNDQTRISMYLAQNIAQLRGKRNLSQLQLAKLAGVPRTTLTHIESGSGNPSLANLAKIAASLSVSIEELLSRPRQDISLIEADQVPLQTRGSGNVQIAKLMPDKIKGIEIDRLEFAVGSVMGGHPHLQGTKEYLSVIHGELTVHISGEVFVVKKGGVLAFPGNQAHSYKNTSRGVTLALSIVIPIPAFV